MCPDLSDVIEILRGEFEAMKKNIHPEYFQAKVVCAGCRNSFTVGSTLSEVAVTVCSACHPFYTGKQTLVDSEGRVERFRRKYAKTSTPEASGTPAA